jgi:plastocyanin
MRRLIARHSRRAGLGAGGMLLALLLIAAAGDHVARLRPVSAATQIVQAADDYFAPFNLTVSAGDTVTWTNTGLAVHSVAGNDGTWDSGVLATGAGYSHVYSDPGTFTYQCVLHFGMNGTITVSP